MHLPVTRFTVWLERWLGTFLRHTAGIQVKVCNKKFQQIRRKKVSYSKYSSTLCPKKLPTLSLPVSSPNINLFSKFFNWHILWTIYVIAKHPTAP